MRTLYQVVDSCFLVASSHGRESENSPGSLIRALISFAALIFITLAAKVHMSRLWSSQWPRSVVTAG